VLPFERGSDTDALGSVDAFIYDAFSAWRGLTVLDPFQVRDAVTRRQSLSGVERDRSVAIALGAGRFVRGSIVARPGGAGWRVFGSLHQVTGRSDSLLYSRTIDIGAAELATAGLRYAEFAQLLLLRGADSAAGARVLTTTVLPAMQSFTRGIAAVDEWNFAEADSQFAAAIVADPQYRRAYLWQAQVRFWQRANPEQWAPLAAKALGDTARLPLRDVRLAVALAALGSGKYEQACAAYDTLRLRNDNDFAAWFGLGRCRDLDFRIVPDSRSPTGWRYLSSYADAVAAYQKAFEVLSLSHVSLERGAFEPLRELLFMRPSKLQLAIPPAGTKESFVGRLDWEGGKPVLRPVPMSLISAGDPAGVPAGMRRAIASQQELFATIAQAWSTALPGSAGAKEAVAVALEMRGDRSALDTLRVARARATDSEARLRLASAEVVMRLKLLRPADSNEVLAIRGLADSLLGSHPRPSDRDVPFLTPLAAVTGRCERLRQLLMQAPFSSPRGVPRDALSDADALVASATLGCAVNHAVELRRIWNRIESTSAPPGTAAGLLLRAAHALEGRDSAITATFAQTGSYLLAAQQASIRGQHAASRAILNRVDSARARTGHDDISPGATYLEARVQLQMGDSSGAMARLDRGLDRLAFVTPGMLNKPVEMAGLMRVMALRGGQWLSVRRMLWSNADPELGAQR
jgi:tetratricopeptide (TPR) repeat protein